MLYFARDAACILTTVTLIATIASSETFAALSTVVQILALLPLQFMGGFFMWCMFVVGHDCGHGTFSPSNFVNQIMGELGHSVLLVTPFEPWRLSHKRHHAHHNHITKENVFIYPFARYRL